MTIDVVESCLLLCLVCAQLLGNTAIWGDPALGSMIQQFTGDSQFGQLNVDVPAVFRCVWF